MSGTLAGKHYRVAGRVVMGMEDAGETYYWNEFNLVNDEGESATLVYEQSVDGETGACSRCLSRSIRLPPQMRQRPTLATR